MSLLLLLDETVAAGPTGTFAATTRRAAMAFAGDISGVTGVLGITTRRAYMDFTGDVTGAIGQFAATTRRNTMQFGEAVAAVTRRRILRLRNFLRVGR